MGTGRSGIPKGVRNTTNKVTSNAVNAKVKSFRQLSAEDAAKVYMDARNALRSGTAANELTNNGMNDTALQYLVHNLGMHEPGAVLPDRDFDTQAKTEALDGVVLYRGADKRAIDNIMYGEKMYIGEGIHGDGIYLSTSPLTAKSYGRYTVTAYIDKSLANVVKEGALRKMLAAEPISIRDSFRGNTGLSAYALYKGYNVIHVPGGNGGTGYAYRHGHGGEDYYVPLTRRVLIMREHSKAK